MSTHGKQRYWEAQHTQIEPNVEEHHAPILPRYQEEIAVIKDWNADGEKSSSEILQLYLKNIGYACGKKRRRCISQELG